MTTVMVVERSRDINFQRSRVSEWEFETWRVRRPGETTAQVIAVNGEAFDADDCPRVTEALTLAQADRWEVFDDTGERIVLRRRRVDGLNATLAAQ